MCKARLRQGIALGVVLGIFAFSLSGRENTPRKLTKQSLSGYEAMRASLGELYQQQKYGEAADLLDEALLRFPAHIKANTYNLALMCVHLQQFDRGVKALLYGLEQGIWYGKFDFLNALWEPYKTHSGFQNFLKKNQKFLEQAQKSAKSELMVKTPAEFSSGKKYPLFVALHGGGENMLDFSRKWKSKKLENEFIVAFVQSSQVISMDGYNWTEDMEISSREIYEAYQSVVQKYPVNTEQVIIGGFSSGGVASLEMALAGRLPVQGFVVLCPAKPEEFTAKRVAAAAQRGLRGTLLTTEMDGRLDDQKEMARILDQENLPCEFIITPDIGHWYPEDLEIQIDLAIARILDK